MTEEWRWIPGYVGSYKISNHGRVLSFLHSRQGRIRTLDEDGPYLRVFLSLRSGGKKFFIHQLVLVAFVSKRPPLHEACHNDGNKRNNHVDNLRWDTRVGNANDRYAHGTHARGSKSVLSKITWDMADQIRESKDTLEDLEKKYPLRKSQLSRIRSRKCWVRL